MRSGWISGVSRTHVAVIDDSYTAQAFITTDLDANQIIAFHPGAMDHSHNNEIEMPRASARHRLARWPQRHDRACGAVLFQAGIPFIFDPGQGLPMFDGEELTDFIDKAT